MEIHFTSEQETHMEMLPVTPERKAQLDEYAERHGQDTAAALDEVLANYLEWERADYDDTVAAVMEAHADVKAGLTRPADEFLEELRVTHGLPR
jgi:predicted transcriptional regulator